jgi:hypothetical protein
MYHTNIQLFLYVQLALKRVQGSGLPKNGLKDDKMVALLTDAITKMDDLLVILEKP